MTPHATDHIVGTVLVVGAVSIIVGFTIAALIATARERRLARGLLVADMRAQRIPLPHPDAPDSEFEKWSQDVLGYRVPRADRRAS